MKINRCLMRFFLAAFFLVMLFPLWGLFFSQPEVESLEENRSMTEWSFSGSLKDRIATLEEYLNDHLAFRQAVIAGVLRANLLLGESPHPLVASGFDGWLFYITGSEDLRRGSGLDRDQLLDLYDTQQAAADALSAAGVDYRILIAPDKSTVYSRCLPLSSRMGSGPSTVDQMLTPPGSGYTVRFTDVRPALISAAENGLQQYYRTDTHWTPNGAWTAYQVLIDDLFPAHPEIRRLREEDLKYSETVSSGDLAAMIGQKGIMTDRFESVSLRSVNWHTDPDRSDGTFTVTVNDSAPDAPRLLLICDSFGGALQPFLAASFSEVWTMSRENVSFAAFGDLSRFDIVIYEIVERDRSALWNGIPVASGEEDKWYEDGGEYWE